MDLAKNFAQWRSQPPEQWLAQANRVLPPLAAIVLVVIIASQAANLTWRLLDGPDLEAPVPPAMPMVGDTRTGGGTFESLREWSPFGRPPEPSSELIPASDIIDAPETELPLKLHGVIQYQETPQRGSMVRAEEGRAVIAGQRGQQKVYRTGETIDDGNGAKLHSVYKDSVRLDRGGGRLESLYLIDEKDSSNSNNRNSRLNSNVAAQQPRPLRTDNSPSTAASLADAVTSAAARIGQYMTVTAAEENGEVIGYRLQPRGDSQVFASLGLQPGDVLVEVNGTRLAGDLRANVQVLQALGETSQASVTIRRNGVDQAQVINIGDIQRLAESLQ